jgi:ABC-type branched-subunit amino acid transport system substrate-binding protein
MKTFQYARLLLLALAVLAPAAAWCQKDKAPIIIGHAGAYNSPGTKELATGLRDGGKILIDSVNASGGVLGRKVRLEAFDSERKPELVAKLYQIARATDVAWLTVDGTETINYLMKQGLLDGAPLPIIGTIPANEQFRAPLRKNVFHFRAGDRDQLAKIVEQLTTQGVTRIAIISRNTSSGTEATAIIAEELAKRGLKPLGQVQYDITSEAEYAKPVKLMKELNPAAIILHGTPQGIAEVTKRLKQAGVTAMLCAASYADYQQVGKLLGTELARGFIISQVMPNLNNRSIPIIKAFREDYDKYGPKTEPTQFHLEGYLSAKLIVEAIKRSKDASPQGVIKGLEQMHDFDLGGFLVDFSPTKHTGSTWVDLSMISNSGKLIY